MRLIVLLWIIINVYFFFHSLFKIRNGKENECEFIYPLGFLIGVFVYEDLLVYSLYSILVAFISLFFSDFKILILGGLVFWFIRGLGETMYFMFQQFTTPNFHPHNISGHFALLKKFVGNISDQKCFIIMQVLLQTVTMLSLFFLILLLMNWNLINLKF